MLIYDAPGDQKFGAFTYAQHGEDLFFVNLFRLLQIEKPSYLDLGAHHPFFASNTALLYERGSRGVNVEANPYLLEEFKKMRPEDQNVNIGVGPYEGKAMFYLYDKTSPRNSLKKSELMRDGLDPTEEMEIDILPPMEIVNKYCNGKFPDLLTLDIEGLDHEVLQMCNFSRSAPSVICAEIGKGFASKKTREMMRWRGFLTLCRIQTNLIFIQGALAPLLVE